MGKFNSDDHYIYYCGQESLRRKWGSHHSQQKSLKCNTWVQSQKRQNDLCSFPSKPFNITVIQVYALTSNAEEAEVEWFYEDLQDLLVRNRTLGPPLENNPEIPPSSRDEGLRLLHGLATNLATSLQTPQEA